MAINAAAGTDLLAEVERGSYLLEPMTGADGGRARAIIARYADLGIELADASILVLAERHQAQQVLTLDERHFWVMTAGGKPFSLLPADVAR